MIILEDNRKYTEWACLYDFLYERENVIFSMGHGNLCRVIREHINEKELFVYVDVVPENLNTSDIVFKNLIEKYYKYNNVYIVPIFCAEYCLLKSFYECDLINLSKEEISILNLSKSYFDTTYKNFKSFEKVLKQMLRSHIDSGSLRDLCKSLDCREASLFLVNHTAYNQVDKIKKYFKGYICNKEYVYKLFFELYDRLYSVEEKSLNGYSNGISYVKSFIGGVE